MTDLELFRRDLEQAAPMLSAWGEHVMATVKDLAKANGIVPQILCSRVKDIDSAIGKLSRKSYTDPMTEMTDLVGVRIVCLLSLDAERLVDSVKVSEEWDAQISRDTAKEAENTPEQFGYQSVHFEIRPKTEISSPSGPIKLGTCCELQVRTLMQHAYAEVVHDNIYKSTWGAPSKARRFVSSSAALIETADHLFCETMNILEIDNQARGEVLAQLTNIYDSRVTPSSGKDQKFNMIVLDELKPWISNETANKISALLDSKSYISERIKERINTDPFWSQPVSLLAYLLAFESPDIARENWPFAESNDALATIFSDLGNSFYMH